MRFELLSELNELDPVYLRCADFVLANINYGMSKQELRRSITEAGKGGDYNFIVAIDSSGKPLGFLSFGIRRDRNDILYNRVYVDPKNRRRKIATKLFFALIHEMKKIGMERAIAFAATKVIQALIAKINQNPRKWFSQGKTSWHERIDKRGTIELNPEAIKRHREIRGR